MGKKGSATRPDISDSDILKALEETGSVGLASEVLGMSRQSIWVRTKTKPKLKAAIDKLKEFHLDIAVDQLFINILEKKETSLIYYLNCQGRMRGYGNFRQDDRVSKEEPEPLDPKFY